MAYQTGTSTDIFDLLDKVRVLAVANGWAQDGWDGAILNLHSGSTYVHFYASTEDTTGPILYMRGSSGFTAAGWDGHPDLGPTAATNKFSGPFAVYYLFVTSQYIHGVAQNTGGHWKHFSAGELTKNSTYNGGTYIQGVCWYFVDSDRANSIYHNRLFDNKSNYYYRGVNSISAEIEGVYTWFLNRYDVENGTSGRYVEGYLNTSVDNSVTYADINTLLIRGVSDFNNLTTLHAVPQGVQRGSDYFSVIGHPEDFRVLNMQYYNPGDMIVIGSDEWLLFPIINKIQGDSNTPYSEWYGYAYRKRP
ncbi:hypothetical protein [Candidatus Vondammii sp. HM_W22]|uniref:hypothetical protein n=1 Tax=Candidatus Vondammii sp. HM_W22 TaxID=2687299 RepID=UPI002E7B0669|nr:hypothetical protein [Candidatus Vondammii sp. HM_W22]